MPSARTLAVLIALTCAPLPAQLYGDGRDGALAPTADLTLNTTANGGVFQFTSIQIPQGVTVRLTGPNPARLLCRGAVDIAGNLDASAPGSTRTTDPGGIVVSTSYSVEPGPGGFRGGVYMQPGSGPGGGPLSLCMYPAITGGSAAHATVPLPDSCHPSPAAYGASMPFDLRGGSGGAGSEATASMGNVGPPASGGGGVIVLLAGGRISVTGSVTARGGDITFVGGLFFAPSGTGGCGSGGSILLRSLQCVRISGLIDTRGGSSNSWIIAAAGNGFIRIDGYSACGAPDVTGATFVPAPRLTAMPWLTELEPARIGQTYRIRCASAPGDLLGLYLSFGRSSLPVPPFGVVELDPAFILDLGQFTVPVTGHDPLAAADITVPNVPALIGLTAYSQMFNAYGTVTGQPRLSNVLTTRIGS